MLTITEGTSGEQAPVRRPALAPWQHTLFLVVVLGLWALYGAMRSGFAANQTPRPMRYISTIVVQYLLVGSTIAGVYHRRQFVFNLLNVSAGWRFGRDLLTGVGIFLAGLFASIIVRLIMRFGPLHIVGRNSALKAMAPQTSTELVLWIAVAVTAGTCEEFIFRGYLQRQVSAWSGSVVIGITASTLLFGCMHIYQGIPSAIGITALGLVYGICAARLGNLRGVMIAHTLQDALAGLVYFMKHSQ